MLNARSHCAAFCRRAFAGTLSAIISALRAQVAKLRKRLKAAEAEGKQAAGQSPSLRAPSCSLGPRPAPPVSCCRTPWHFPRLPVQSLSLLPAAHPSAKVPVAKATQLHRPTREPQMGLSYTRRLLGGFGGDAAVRFCIGARSAEMRSDGWVELVGSGDRWVPRVPSSLLHEIAHPTGPKLAACATCPSPLPWVWRRSIGGATAI